MTALHLLIVMMVRRNSCCGGESRYGGRDIVRTVHQVEGVCTLTRRGVTHKLTLDLLLARFSLGARTG